MRTLIKPELLITGVDGEEHIPFIHGGEVQIDNGRIVYAGKADGAPRFEADMVIDGAGKMCMPGLCNAHTHLPMTALRSVGGGLTLADWLNTAIFPLEREWSDDAIAASARLGLLEMLRFGTTSFIDMYMHMDALAGAVKESGIRATLSYGVVDFDGSADDLKPGTEFYDKWNHASGDRIRAALAPHSEGATTPAAIRALTSAAKERGALIHVHISETKADLDGCLERHGCTPVRYFFDMGLLDLPVVAAHCVWATDEDIEILRDKGVTVAHNPVSNLKLASGVAPIKKMLDAGCRVALGTDGVASNNNHNLWEEIKLMPMLQKGTLLDPLAVTPAQTLRAATVAGARAMQYDDLGLLKPGYRADIIMLDINRAHMLPNRDMEENLIYAAQGSDVCMTMVDGNVLYQDGKYTTLDEKSILRKANGIIDELITRRDSAASAKA